MKHSLNSLIKNGGKVVKKTLKIATAISEDEYAAILREERQDFTKHLR